MVQKTEDVCIEVRSELNDWINGIFIVGKDNADKAQKILDDAYTEYFHNDVQECIGDWLEDHLRDADIQYEVLWL